MVILIYDTNNWYIKLTSICIFDHYSKLYSPGIVKNCVLAFWIEGQNTIFNDPSHILRYNSFYRFLKYDRCKLIISFQFTDSILSLCAHSNQRRVRSNQSSLHVQGLVGADGSLVVGHVARVEVISDSLTPIILTYLNQGRLSYGKENVPYFTIDKSPKSLLIISPLKNSDARRFQPQIISLWPFKYCDLWTQWTVVYSDHK